MRLRPLESWHTFAALKNAVAVALVKQRSVAQRVHRSELGCSRAPGGRMAAVNSGSSKDATWLDTVMRACIIECTANLTS
jgi:hypothetical protein